MIDTISITDTAKWLNSFIAEHKTTLETEGMTAEKIYEHYERTTRHPLTKVHLSVMLHVKGLYKAGVRTESRYYYDPSLAVI